MDGGGYITPNIYSISCIGICQKIDFRRESWRCYDSGWQGYTWKVLCDLPQQTCVIPCLVFLLNSSWKVNAPYLGLLHYNLVYHKTGFPNKTHETADLHYFGIILKFAWTTLCNNNECVLCDIENLSTLL